MKQDINEQVLADFRDAYEQDKVQKVVRHALHNHAITESASVQEASFSVLNQFSIDIPTLPCTNQKQSGRCWIFAGLNVLREIVFKNTKMEGPATNPNGGFELSQNYTAFWDKFEKVNYMMEALIRLKDEPWDDRTLTWVLQNGIQDGGQWDMFTAVVKKYGVVPQSAMPETYQSCHTRDIVTLLNRKMRIFAKEVRNVSEEDLPAFKEAKLKECYNMLCSSFGVPPTVFDFEYIDENKQYQLDKGLTPHSFYEKYIGIDLDDYISIIHSPTQDKPYYQTFTIDLVGNIVGVPVHYLNLPMEEMKAAVIAQMKDKEPVWFGSDCSKYGERNEGYWAPEAYDFNSLFDTDFFISKEDALDTRESFMVHAMVLTGVNLIGDKSTKWKIENSWGTDHAHKGYYVATDLWFDEFVYQSVVNKKYLSDKAKEALKTRPIELKPWDPMGTLAD